MRLRTYQFLLSRRVSFCFCFCFFLSRVFFQFTLCRQAYCPKLDPEGLLRRARHEGEVSLFSGDLIAHHRNNAFRIDPGAGPVAILYISKGCCQTRSIREETCRLGDMVVNRMGTNQRESLDLTAAVEYLYGGRCPLLGLGGAGILCRGRS